MEKNRQFIEKVLKYRNELNDPIRQFATRNKASPILDFEEFQDYNEQDFKQVYNNNIDGATLKFKYVTLVINGRHKST